MKKLLYIVPLLLGMALTSCYDEDIENINSRLDAIENTQIATISQQITSINNSILLLNNTDKELKDYITTLEKEAKELEAKLGETNTKIDTVKSELTETISTEKAAILAELEAFKATVNGELEAIKAVLETLKAKDAELDKQIADLKEYVDSELTATEDWATATFATLEQYNTVVSTIATIEGAIKGLNESISALETRINEKIAKDIETACAALSADLQNAVKEVTEAYTSAITTAKNELSEAYTAALEGAISALETSMKEWVNEQLTGYYTIAQMDAKLEALQNSLTEGDGALQKEIDALRESLAAQKTELTEAYTAAITEAINTNNGVIDAKIASAIDKVNEQIAGLEERINTLEERITKLEGTMSEVQEQVAALVARIQSISYIPRYSDGKASIDKTKKIGVFEFQISPKDAVAELEKVWQSALTMQAVHTQTRAVSFIEFPVTYFDADTENGTFLIEVDAANLGDQFFSGDIEASASLHISDGNNDRTSEYINLVVGEVESFIPNNNEIWYTNGSTTEPTTPNKTDVFGANIVSNTYNPDKGYWVIKFDSDITSIGTELERGAFHSCTSLISIIIPKSVTEIGRTAFYACYSLRSVTIPNSVVKIGYSAFNNCISLTSITIPDSVTEIGINAFINCSSLTSITIPDSVVSIGDYAFSGCTSLTSITIPDSVTSIGNGVFRGCTSLTSVTIPDSVTSIGNYAFYDCSSLTSVYCKPTTPPTGYSYMFYNNASGRKIYVPTESVEEYKVVDGWSEYADAIVTYDFDQDPDIIDGDNYMNLSEVSTANCYIVESAGNYMFNGCVIGNGGKGIIADANFHTNSASIMPYKVEIVWDDNNVVSGLYIEDGFIHFTASSNEGNALIAAKDSADNIIWSWHIWATDKPQDYPNHDGYLTIDRNLGATSANYQDGEDTYGLYYQWGRKDPLRNNSIVVDTEETTGCISYTLEHPTQLVGGNSYNWQYSNKSEYLWGYKYNTKTIYDPCPVGYKVSYPVTSSSAYVYDSSRTGGRWDGELWYPFAGRLDWETGTFCGKDDYDSSIDEYGNCGFYYVNTYSNFSKNDTYDQYFSASRVLIDNLQYKGFAESVRCIRE